LTIFCFLWVPLFYMFYRSFTRSGGFGVWALILGSITAIVQFFMGNFITPGGFGISRALFGFVDIVSVPVLLPVFVYLILLISKRFSVEIDFGDFALLWLIPVGALKALSWSTTNDPILMIMAPLLWTALAVGISFFINLMIKKFTWYTLIISVICILILPVISSFTYWAFFSQLTLYGFGLLFLMHVPVVVSVISGIRSK